MDRGPAEPNSDPSEQDEVDILLSRIETEGLTPSQVFATGQWTPGPWQPPTPEELQEQIPSYRVLELIGRGGMGAVYRGWQNSLDRYVAIKILPLDADSGSGNFALRFKQEAKTMAKFQHPGIVSIYNAGETPGGLLYIVMEFIEGSDVSKIMDSQGRMNPLYALAVTAHVCDALHYAHNHGVIHRDIKPANVLINAEGEVKVADFGLARSAGPADGGITNPNMAVGTPDYVAPEAMIMGIKLDGRADLYAVGVMLYAMLTGRVPRGMFEPPSVVTHGESDERFDAIIAKAMEADREKRYQTAFEIRQDLDAILTAPRLEAHGSSSVAIPKQELAIVRQKMIAQKPVSRRPGMQTQRVREVVTFAPVPEKKSTLPILTICAAAVVLALGGYFGWQKLAHHTPPPSTTSVAAPAAAPVVVLPEGTLTFGGHHYFFVKEPVTWETAKARAADMHGHLATLTTKEEKQWAHEQILLQSGLTAHVMIGGLQATRGSPWTWVTGEPFDMGLWDNKHPPDGSGPFLTLMRVRNDVLWDDVSARDRDSFLVEWDDLTTPIPATPAPIQRAPAGALAFGGHRYQFFPDTEPWDKAKEKAEKMGGHLATLTTPEEDEWVRRMFVSSLPAEKVIHLGGFRAKDSRQWSWVTGEPWSYQKEDFGQNDSSSRMGLQYFKYAGGPGIWSGVWGDNWAIPSPDGQTRIAGFLVEWDTDQVESALASSRPAPYDALLFGGHRYKFFLDDEPWLSAKKKAEKMGGHLATLTTPQEDEWARKTFLSTVPSERVIHLGGFRSDDKSPWTWVTGEPWSYQGSPFPINSKTEPMGLEYLSKGKGSGEWTARWDVAWWMGIPEGPEKGLSRIRGYLVEWDTDAVGSPVVAPAGALPFGGHRFLPVYADVSWREAKEQALAMGGHLATLTTPEKNEWVRKTFVGKLPKEKFFYIGGIKTIGETAKWEWVTGESWTFDHWEGNRKPAATAAARGATLISDGNGGAPWAARSEDPGKKPANAVGFLVEWDTDRVASGLAFTSQPNAGPDAFATINLLADVDVKRDALTGFWGMTPDGLAADKESGDRSQTLEFNQIAPEEYDFEIEFTITGGGRNVNQILPLPTHLILWKMGLGNTDPTSFGFGPYLDGKLISGTTLGEANVVLPRLNIGQRYRSLIEVRKGSLRALLDGKEILKWSGDFARLTLGVESSGWSSMMKSQRHLGVATFVTDAVFHKAELRPRGDIAGKLAELEVQFNDAYERDVTRSSAGKAVADLDGKYLAALENAISEATRDGRLDDVIALRQETQRIADKEPLPVSDPVNIVSSLGKLRDIYREAVKPLIQQRAAASDPLYERYDQALAVMEADFARQGLTGAVAAVQEKRAAIERQRHPTATSLPSQR